MESSSRLRNGTASNAGVSSRGAEYLVTSVHSCGHQTWKKMSPPRRLSTDEEHASQGCVCGMCARVFVAWACAAHVHVCSVYTWCEYACIMCAMQRTCGTCTCVRVRCAFALCARVSCVCVFCVHAHVCVIVCMHTRVSGESHPWRWQEHRSQKLWGHVGRSRGTEPLAGKTGQVGGREEEREKPAQDERSGGASGARPPERLLSPSCCGSSDPCEEEKVLSFCTPGERLSGAMAEGTRGCERGSLKAEPVGEGAECSPGPFHGEEGDGGDGGRLPGGRQTHSERGDRTWPGCLRLLSVGSGFLMDRYRPGLLPF